MVEVEGSQNHYEVQTGDHYEDLLEMFDDDGGSDLYGLKKRIIWCYRRLTKELKN